MRRDIPHTVFTLHGDKKLVGTFWVNTLLSFGGIFASSFAEGVSLDAKDPSLLLYPNLQIQEPLAHFITNVSQNRMIV